jgi:hypothetical protein
MAYTVFVFNFNPYGSIIVILSRCRWEDDIKMDLQEVGLGGIDRLVLSGGRDRWLAVVNAVMNLRFP